jgi:flavin-dependent dehydrogenase
MVRILGGGPAGAAAALAALEAGAGVQLIERARTPRHKVCGEFFSPEIEPDLKALGVWEDFRNACPARIERAALCFGARRREGRLPVPGWGLSRYAFDALLLELARRRGARIVAEAGAGGVAVLASGRRASRAPRGRRPFGFKAHFEGPSSRAVELYFFDGGYVGVSPIEGGRTNVCGLAAEDRLGRFGFSYDDFVLCCPALAERLAPLRRATPWLTTGPLECSQRLTPAPGEPYPAGDALSFVDPFTGSGLLAAIRSGAIAGRAAARGQPPQDYLAECRRSLRRPFQVASLLRGLLASGWAERLAVLAPTTLLFALTRPR